MSAASIHVHIERVVLDGLDVERADAPRVQAALEAELTRLLAEGGLSRGLAAGASVPALRGATLEAAAERAPAALGAGIARAVYGGIGAAVEAPAGAGGERRP